MKHATEVIAVLIFAALAFGCGATHQYYSSSGTPDVIGAFSGEYASVSQPSYVRTERTSLLAGKTADRSDGNETGIPVSAAGDPPSQSAHASYYPGFGWRDNLGHRLPN